LKRWLILTIIISLGFSFCATSKGKFAGEFDFANNIAQEGLWKEAYYRWQKALDNNEAVNKAIIYNNMAIALERMGRLKEAEETYKKALKIKPGDSYIKANLAKLKKILDKGKKENENKDK